MIAHSKPIALPNTNNSQLSYTDGFYTDTFNPASFTRHFLGSPISWRPSSFSAPTAQLLSKTPMDDSLLNAVNVFEREGELCRNYTCCNLQLNDLHALLEHFEQVHILVLDPTSTQPQAQLQVPFNPIVHDTKKPFIDDSDEMELDIDLGTRPQAISSLSSRQAFNPYARFASDYSSSMPGALFNGDDSSALHSPNAWQVQQQQPQQQQSQEGCVPPALLFSSSAQKHQGQSKNNLVKALSTTSLHRHQHHQNSSSISSSSSQPTSPSSATSISHPHSLSRPGSLLLCKPFRCPKPNCNKSYKQANGLKYHMTHGSCNFAPPKDLEHVKDLLERKRREREGLSGDSENGTGLTRSASLGSAPHQQSITIPSTPMSSAHPSPLSHSASPATSPPSSASTSSAPSPQPSPPLHSVKNSRLSPSAILTYSDLSNFSEHDLREVEREAERRLRPYACGIGECQRRYKNMNGLRYHYQHSGDHGALGLALLSSGQHGIDVKPDVSNLGPATTPILGNTSPTQVQSQGQAQAYQLQLQQFQQQQLLDQQQAQVQNQHQQDLANYHYAQLQGQYQLAYNDNNSGMLGMTTGFDSGHGMSIGVGSDAWMWKS